jgi:hypothetical protein
MHRLLVIESDRNSADPGVLGQTRQPAMLQVNQEARNEGFRYYWKCEERLRNISIMPQMGIPGQQCHRRPTLPAKKRNKLYINFEVDRFIQPPIAYSIVRPITSLSFNFEPWVLNMVQKYVNFLACVVRQICLVTPWS